MNIVLVHGGWHGGWCWRPVASILEAGGHRVLAPTLTGVGERSHLAHPDITPDLHVKDVENVIRWNELEDIVLVGHSYGGMIITGIASRMPERIARLVYLDAYVPTISGQSVFSMGTKERELQIRASIVEGFLVPPVGFALWSADPGTRAWLRSMATPHPIRCFSEGPTLTGRESEITDRLFIRCTDFDPSPIHQFHERYRDDPAWKSATMPCLHDAMLEMPVDVANLITKTEAPDGR